ncbi:MAG: DUF547 domain-containing protein [Pseudomonadota bacterium]
MAIFSRGMDSRSPGSWLIALMLMLAGVLGTPNSKAADNEALFAPYAALLDASVENGWVDYAAFKQSDAFAAMVREIGTTPLSSGLSRDERLATFINAYNVLSIQGILDGFSPSSVFSRLRFFKRREYEVFGSSMTLYELEHKRIISEGDPRIHFAIVCSSKSCPPLISELYLPETLDTQLDQVAANFINNPASNSFDRSSNEATLSRIFKWYRDEFEAQAGSLAAYLARYVSDPELKQSLLRDDWSFGYHDYDWSLNGSPAS